MMFYVKKGPWTLWLKSSLVMQESLSTFFKDNKLLFSFYVAVNCDIRINLRINTDFGILI